MSGIAGLLGLDGRPAQPEDLRRMVDSLAHRGPDGRSTWHDGPVGLGHCMLHTTPESLTERLPLERDGLAITADARIDNREELLDSLAMAKEQRGRLSDSEIILLAYRRWREGCAARLIGDFAFAIWDSHQRHLFCARDHFGIRPFYYHHEPGQRFIFGSEIKTLFCFEDLPKVPNEDKIADYMLEMFEDKSRTFYRDIHRLPPATTLTVGRRGANLKEYWTLDPSREVQLCSDAEYAEAFRGLFIEAVRCRLRSAFPIGTTLSGGLDSSSIACVAQDLIASQSQDSIHSFSIVFDEIKASDEREHIEKVRATRPFQSHYVSGDRATPFDHAEEMLRMQDEPYYAPNLHLTSLVWRSANENGVRVLLEGLLGDNVLSHGIEYLNELAGRGHWIELAKQLRRYLDCSGREVPLARILTAYIVQQGFSPRLPEPVLKAWRRFKRYPTDPVAKTLGRFQKAYAERVGLRGRLEQAYRDKRTIQSCRQVHAKSLVGGVVETAFEAYDKGCSGFPLEPRFPFADRRLVEFCVASPGTQKINHGYTRIVLRQAMKGILPEGIRWRHDKGDLGHAFLSGVSDRLAAVTGLIQSSETFLGQFFPSGRLRGIASRTDRKNLREDQALELFLITLLAMWRNQVLAAGRVGPSEELTAA